VTPVWLKLRQINTGLRQSHNIAPSKQFAEKVPMQIEELSKQASLELLAEERFGRLACAKESQPYITPFYYTYYEDTICSFTTVGQKITWMRANPLVCVEVDRIKSSQQWSSVIVYGRYLELPISEWQPTCEKIWNLLNQHEVRWEPGLAKTIIDGRVRPLVPVYFRILIDQITGHRASLEGGSAPL
jgi:nitroimidazol reductase NimA-like FMN-containing flavoprotein (pyridoxamine 5'-phosphate oxidase superfamily)